MALEGVRRKVERLPRRRVVRLCEHGTLHRRPLNITDPRDGGVALLEGRNTSRSRTSRPRVYLDDRRGVHRRDTAIDSSLAGVRRTVGDGLLVVRRVDGFRLEVLQRKLVADVDPHGCGRIDFAFPARTRGAGVPGHARCETRPVVRIVGCARSVALQRLLLGAARGWTGVRAFLCECVPAANPERAGTVVFCGASPAMVVGSGTGRVRGRRGDGKLARSHAPTQPPDGPAPLRQRDVREGAGQAEGWRGNRGE